MSTPKTTTVMIKDATMRNDIPLTIQSNFAWQIKEAIRKGYLVCAWKTGGRQILVTVTYRVDKPMAATADLVIGAKSGRLLRGNAVDKATGRAHYAESPGQMRQVFAKVVLGRAKGISR